jgi:hypothetical protein
MSYRPNSNMYIFNVLFVEKYNFASILDISRNVFEYEPEYV